MTQNSECLRVVIAVTETSPVQALWKAALQNMSASPAELIALFLTDDRWRSAASLPFTREVSRIGGTIADFTLHRAEEVSREAMDRTHRLIQQLAAESNITFAFKVLAEPDPTLVPELSGEGHSILVAPAVLGDQPICVHFQKLGWQIVLIETTETRDERQ